MNVNVKSFSSHMAHRAALISVSLAVSQTPVYTARPRYGVSASRGVPACLRPNFRFSSLRLATVRSRSAQVTVRSITVHPGD